MELPGGSRRAFTATKKLKDAKIEGVKGMTVNPNKLTHDKKSIRTKREIFGMQTHIREQLGNNIATGVLAWAAGEITTNEAFDSVAEYAESIGKRYQRLTDTEALV